MSAQRRSLLGVPVHAAAAAFPLMDGEEFDQLVEDIRANGQRVPCVFNGETLLDGRNRIRACERLGLEYEYEEWDGKGSETAYVLSVNLHRRHLTTSQRAAIAVELLPTFQAEAKERQREGQKRGGQVRPKSRPNLDEPSAAPPAPTPKDRDRLWSDTKRASHEAARSVQVSHTTVEKAAAVRREDPELFEQVKAGTKTLSQATRQIEKLDDVKEIGRNDPSARWAGFWADVLRLVASVERAGMQTLLKRWGPDGAAKNAKRIRELIEKLNGIAAALEG